MIIGLHKTIMMEKRNFALDNVTSFLLHIAVESIRGLMIHSSICVNVCTTLYTHIHTHARARTYLTIRIVESLQCVSRSLINS